MLEKYIEQALVRKVKAIGGMCEKFTSPNKRSVPDRIVTLPGGRIIFVECKATGKKPTKAQASDHKRRRAMGCTVIVVDSCKQIDEFMEVFGF